MAEARVIAKYIRISPRKMVGICKLVRGKDLLVAKSILLRSSKKSAKLINKALKSVVANAKGKNMDEKRLFISKITADQGPSLKRILYWSRGVARPIKKRMSHLTIILSERETLVKKKAGKDEKKETVERKTETTDVKDKKVAGARINRTKATKSKKPKIVIKKSNN